MKFSISRVTLSNVLGYLNDIVPNRSASHVLQNIKMKGNEDGTITLSATDLEIGLRYTIPVDDMQEPDTLLLPARKLYGLIKDDWASIITFAIKDYKATITSENGKFRLMGQSEVDFPEIKTGNEYPIKMNGSDVSDAIGKTIFSASKGDTRYALNGIMVCTKGNEISFVSSDTHRLSLVKKKIDSDVEEFRAIVVTKGMDILSKLSEGEEKVGIAITKNALVAETSNAVMTARLIDGQFPRYDEVIPKDLDKLVTVDRDLLVKTIRLAGQMTNDETKAISLTLKSDSLVVSARGNDSGDGTTEIPADVSGDVSATFNFTYIMELLRVVYSECITIKLRDDSTPARIDVGDFTHIIMPVRAK